MAAKRCEHPLGADEVFCYTAGQILYVSALSRWFGILVVDESLDYSSG
jgi:hypothetical protein